MVSKTKSKPASKVSVFYHNNFENIVVGAKSNQFLSETKSASAQESQMRRTMKSILSCFIFSGLYFVIM